MIFIITYNENGLLNFCLKMTKQVPINFNQIQIYIITYRVKIYFT